jgi:protein involved in polysaccharide export with SLBB domain
MSWLPDFLRTPALLALLLWMGLTSCASDKGPGALDPGLPRVPDWTRAPRGATVDYADQELVFVKSKKPGRKGSLADRIRGRRARDIGPGGVRLLTRPMGDKRSQQAERARRDDGRRFQRTRMSAAPTIESPRDPADISPLEAHYLRAFSMEASREVSQFGYDFFARDGESDAPGGSPTPASYLIGPGDELLVRIWGSLDATLETTVDREGKIDLPEVGKISVTGRPYGELREHLRRSLARLVKNFDVDVTLGRVRGIKVFVVGDVVQPGLHEVTAGTTVLGVLSRARGPRKTGSLRRIQVRRAGSAAVEVDLYDFFLSGDRARDLPLQDGDTIHVPPIGPTVAVSGYVVRPGVFELKDEQRLNDLIALAGGFSPFAYRGSVQVEAGDAQGERRLADVSFDRIAGHRVRNGDLIRVHGVDQSADNVVRLEGNIVRPGEYEWFEGMRLSDLAQLGGGFYTDTWFKRVSVSRVLGERDDYDHIAGRMSGETNHEVLHADLGAALETPGSKADIELAPLDVVTVLAREEVLGTPEVKISGSVQRPGTFELTSGMRASDLIRLAGHVSTDAFLDQAEIVRRIYDDENEHFDVVHVRFDLKGALNSRDRDPLLENHDEIIVRSAREAQVRVRIEGHVKYPGEYVLPQGSRIAELIHAAGGLESDADLRASVFRRATVKETQQKRLDDLVRRATREFERAYEDIALAGNPDETDAGAIAKEQDSAYLRRMRRLQATGRVIVDLCREDFPQSSDDLVLEPGDLLEVPRVNNTVMVLGEVFNPSAMIWREGWSVGDCLDQIGGLTDDSDDERLYLVRANGTVLSAKQIGYSALRDEGVLPGDTLLVPESPTERSFMSNLKDIGELALLFGLATQSFRPESAANGALIR